MMQFQVLTHTPSAPLKAESKSSTSTQTASSHVRRDSNFLVLTVEPEAPEVPKRRDSTFLVLSPVQSDSYPKQPRRSSAPSIPSSEVSVSPVSSPVMGPTSGVPTEPYTLGSRRRTSSSGYSSSSADGKRRFLKLNPVHWGQDDDNEYAIEE